MIRNILNFFERRKNKKIYGTYWALMRNMDEKAKGQYCFSLVEQGIQIPPALWLHAIEHVSEFINKEQTVITALLDIGNDLISRSEYEVLKKRYLVYKQAVDNIVKVLYEFGDRSDNYDWGEVFDKYTRLLARIRAFAITTEEHIILFEEECRIN